MLFRKEIILILYFITTAAGCSGNIGSAGKLQGEGARWEADERIIQLLSQNRFPEAAALTDSLLKSGERGPRLLGQRGYAIGMLGRAEEAVALLEKAILGDYENWWNHFALGRILAEEGMTGRAIAEYREALRFCKGSDCAEVSRNLAVLYLKSKNSSAAREMIDLGLASDPWNGYLIGLKAVIDARARPEAADTLLKRVEGMAGIESSVFDELAAILMNSGKPAAAADAYRRMFERDGDTGTALKLSLALRESEEYDKAVELLERLSPTDAVKLELAKTYIAQKRFQEAVELLRAIPESAESMQSLTAALWKLGRLEEAERCGKRVLELEPDNIPAMINLAAVYAEGGNLKEGKELLEKVLRIDGGNETALENLHRIEEAEKMRKL